MKSNEYIKKLIKMSEENPDLKIIAKVNTDLFIEDDFSWIGADFGDCEIEEYWLPDETYKFSDEIEDDIRESVEIEYGDAEYKEVDKMVNERIEQLRKDGEIKKAIFVEIIP